jgi:hypothetical protein
MTDTPKQSDPTGCIIFIVVAIAALAFLQWQGCGYDPKYVPVNQYGEPVEPDEPIGRTGPGGTY